MHAEMTNENKYGGRWVAIRNFASLRVGIGAFLDINRKDVRIQVEGWAKSRQYYAALKLCKGGCMDLYTRGEWG